MWLHIKDSHCQHRGRRKEEENQEQNKKKNIQEKVLKARREKERIFVEILYLPTT